MSGRARANVPRPTPLKGRAVPVDYTFGTYENSQRGPRKDEPAAAEDGGPSVYFRVTPATLPTEQPSPQRATFNDYIDNPNTSGSELRFQVHPRP